MEDKNTHIVHQSIVTDALLGGVKAQWMGYLALFGMMLFPLSGASPMGIAIIIALLWGVKTFALVPLYNKDPQLIILFALAALGQGFYQGQADIGKSPGLNTKSIPEVNL